MKKNARRALILGLPSVKMCRLPDASREVELESED